MGSVSLNSSSGDEDDAAEDDAGLAYSNSPDDSGEVSSAAFGTGLLEEGEGSLGGDDDERASTDMSRAAVTMLHTLEGFEVLSGSAA